MNDTDSLVCASFYKLGDYEMRLPIRLNPNRSYNPKMWKYPVTWSGRVGWLNVSLVQTSRDEIDFSPLPYEMINAIPHIRGGIEFAIKRLD